MRTIRPLVAAIAAGAMLAACASEPDGPAGPTSSTDPTSTAASRSIVVLADDADDAFTASALSGAGAAADTLDATLDVVDTSPDRLARDVQEALAARPTVVVGVGAWTLDAIDPAAASNLDQQFVVVGGEAPEPTENLTTAVLREHEALHLTGVEAGLTSRSGTVGVVAPPPNALVDAWVDTFSSAAASAGVAVEVARADGDDTSRATADLARRGADVVQGVLLGSATLEGTTAVPSFATGPGGCADGGVVDSIVLDAGAALVATVREVVTGRPGGVHSFGLAEGVVSLASLDGAQGCLVGDDPVVLDAVRAARDAVVDGSVEVPDPDFAR